MTDTVLSELPPGDIAFVTEQIEAERVADLEPTRSARRAEGMRPILWRLHFLGGFLAGPVILSLCVSGILFAWHPQLDDVRFGDIMHRSSDSVEVPLSDQVAAAQTAHAGWEVYAVTPGSGGNNTMVTMDPPGGEQGFGSPSDAEHVYVDQATGAVTGVIAKEETSNQYFRELHSSFRLGDRAEPLTELAGSWFLVTLLTGVYLWWPGLRKRGAIAFAARRRISGRRRDKDWHNFIGVGLFVPMFLLAATGLTWTGYAGDRVDFLKEQLSIPRTGADPVLAAETPGQSDIGNIDLVHRAAVERGLVEPMQIAPPPDDLTGWSVASQDVTFPIERDQLTVDGATGLITSDSEYVDEHWYDKLRTAAILFHQAQLFGLPLQVFMTALTLAIA